MMTNYEYLYDKGESVTNLNHLSHKPLRFRIIENGTILPHKQLPDTHGFCGVIDNNGNFVKNSALGTGEADIYTPNEVQESPLSVIYLGVFVHIWGHCLTDDIKRIWFLNSDIYKKHFRKYPIVYIPMWAGIIRPFAKLLEILGVDVNNLIPVTVPTKYRNIILPDESLFDVFEASEGGGLYPANTTLKNLLRQSIVLKNMHRNVINRFHIKRYITFMDVIKSVRSALQSISNLKVMRLSARRLYHLRNSLM